MNVGVRELKSKLSEYLGRAAAGEEIVVTDRGRPVARLVAYSSATIEQGVAEGWIDPPRRQRLEPVPRHRSQMSVLEAIDEDRG